MVGIIFRTEKVKQAQQTLVIERDFLSFAYVCALFEDWIHFVYKSTPSVVMGWSSVWLSSVGCA